MRAGGQRSAMRRHVSVLTEDEVRVTVYMSFCFVGSQAHQTAHMESIEVCVEERGMKGGETCSCVCRGRGQAPSRQCSGHVPFTEPSRSTAQSATTMNLFILNKSFPASASDDARGEGGSANAFFSFFTAPKRGQPLAQERHAQCTHARRRQMRARHAQAMR
jgi:hypothetical protein